MERFKKMLPAILMILFEIALGVMLLINPEKFTIIAFIAFGSVLILCALAMFVRYLKERKAADEYAKAKSKVEKTGKEKNEEKGDEVKVSVIPLISAVSTFVFGAVFVFGATVLYDVTALLLIFYGAIMVIKGIFKIADYVSLKKEGAGVSALRLAVGIFSVVLGIVVMVNPFGTRDVIFVISAISLLAEAALDIVALVLSVRLAKAIEAEAKDVTDKDDDPYHLDNFAE